MSTNNTDGDISLSSLNESSKHSISDSAHADSLLSSFHNNSSSSSSNNTVRNRSKLAALNNLVRSPPPKTTLCASLLFILGLIFLILGFSYFFSSSQDKGLPLLILGSIMFIPGSYASYIIYGTWRGWPGFDFSQIPSYDD